MIRTKDLTGTPKVAFGLLWILPASKEEVSVTIVEVPPEELHEFADGFSFDLADVAERLAEIANKYGKNRDGLRRLLRRVMQGNELAAEQAMQLLTEFLSDEAPKHPDGDDEQIPPDEGGTVIEFEREEPIPAPNNETDEEPYEEELGGELDREPNDDGDE